MEDGRISDDQITASSSFDAQSVGPQNARIRTEKASGAWCPKSQIRNGSYEFLQVSFNKTHVIRAIETQGRYGNGTGREFAQQYMLDYWRQGTTKWIRYRLRNGTDLIEGNFDTVTPVQRVLDPPIIAQKIRLVPYSVQTRTTCMRMEVYGCEDQEGLLGYSILEPEMDGVEEFKDEIFEQTSWTDGNQKKGLGLLTDGIIPTYPPIDPVFHLPVKNSTWLAFKRSDSDGRIRIQFDFESDRQFADMEIFGYGRPLEKIIVEFSNDGNIYEHPMESDYPQNLLNQQQELYSVKVPLNGRKAGFVQVLMKFSTDSTFLSEIRFNTDFKNATTSILEEFSFNSNKQSQIYYLFITVMIIILVAMTAALCGLLIFRRRKRHGSTEKLSSLGSPSSRSTAATTMSRDLKPTNTLITTLPLNGGQPRHVIHSHSFAPHHGLYGPIKGNLYGDHRVAASTQRILGLAPPSRSCSGTLFKDHHQPSLLDIHFPPPPPSDASTCRLEPALSNSSSEGIYAEPSVPLLGSRRCGTQKRQVPKTRNLKENTLSRKNKTLPLRARQEEEEQHYAIANFAMLPVDRPSSNPGYSAFHPYQHHQPRTKLIPRANVQFIEKIGEGRYTQIFSCYVSEATKKYKAAIKFQHQEAEEARMALQSEIALTHDILHANVNQCLGQTEDGAIITNYCPYGDVRQYMQKYQSLPRMRLIQFCTEIAAGLAYLEQRGIVHGHLSPKSCLLDENLGVKIASPRGPSHHAQLRYSAPEAIVLNNWSNRSDAYSFGMTVWEILHGCTQPPYHDLTNNALFENARNQLESSPAAVYPPFDQTLMNSIDKEIIDLIRDCWSSHPEQRPGFYEIHVFFVRKQLNSQNSL
uniref:Discoidin domain-containing receptor 2 n=2 Tax=Bursaphelenchus xylophilus TaxID=6326 RepID=A0A1I7RJS2_BURXY